MTRSRMIPVRGPEDIPPDMTEQEARAFWDTHEITDEYIERADPVGEDALPTVRPDDVHLGLRIRSDVLRRVKALARKRRTRYRTLINEFIDDRLREEEKREGLVS